MISSHYEGERSRATLRVGLVAMATLEFVGTSVTLTHRMSDPLYHSASPLLFSLFRPTPTLLLIINLIGVVGLAALALNRRPIPASLTALLSMALVARIGAEVFGAVSHNFFFPGALLFGWFLGLVIAWKKRQQGDPEAQQPTYAESVAESCAVGVLAALYTGSALTKVMDSGFQWVNANGLRAILLAQKGLLHVEWIDAYRASIINHPWFAFALTFGALLIEAGAFLLLVGRRLRFVWGLLILGMHVNIMFLAGILYIEPMFLVPLFTIPWPALRRLLTGRARSPDTATANADG